MIERRRLGAIAGMIGPSLFVTVFTIAGWLQPGYRASEMFVSELSLGPRGWIQIGNFLVTGALVFALSPISCVVFLRQFRAEPAWRPLRGPTIAAGMTTAAAVVFMAVLSTRRPEPPNRFTAWNGAVQRVFIVIYLAGIFMFAWRLGRDQRNGTAVRRARRRSSPTSR